jgi:hypothetical protein
MCPCAWSLQTNKQRAELNTMRLSSGEAEVKTGVCRCAWRLASQQTSKPTNQQTRQPTSKPDHRQISQPASQPANHLAAASLQPVSQPTSLQHSDPASQPASHGRWSVPCVRHLQNICVQIYSGHAVVDVRPSDTYCGVMLASRHQLRLPCNISNDEIVC